MEMEAVVTAAAAAAADMGMEAAVTEAAVAVTGVVGMAAAADLIRTGTATEEALNTAHTRMDLEATEEEEARTMAGDPAAAWGMDQARVMEVDLTAITILSSRKSPSTTSQYSKRYASFSKEFT